MNIKPALAIALTAAGTVAGVSWVQSPHAKQVHGTVLLEDYYYAKDGDDYLPAFKRIFSASECTHFGPTDRRGCTILIGAKDHSLSGPIELCRAHHLIGVNGYGAAIRSRLNFAKDSDGIILKDYDECSKLQLGGGAAGVEIQSVKLWSKGRTSSSAKDRFGIMIQTRAILTNVWVESFSIGYAVIASVGDSPKTNANLVFGQNLIATSSEHAGMYARGADSNAGQFNMIDASSNCWGDPYFPEVFAALEEKWGPCANVVDRSFLGNTYIAPHTASAHSPWYTHRRRGFLFEGLTSASTLIGSYSEEDQAISFKDQVVTVVGGMSKWEGGGLHLIGPFADRLIIRSDAGEVILGEKESLIKFRSWDSISHPYEIRFLDKGTKLVGRITDWPWATTGWIDVSPTSATVGKFMLGGF